MSNVVGAKESIYVRPQAGMAPLTVSILARIEPSERNRVFCLVWFIYPEFLNTSCQTLEGLDAPKSFHFYRVLREAGEWTIMSVVKRTDGERRAQATVIVGGAQWNSLK